MIAVGTERQRPDGKHCRQRERPVEMRKQIAVARRLVLQRVSKARPVSRHEHEIVLAGKVQLGRPSRLRSRGQMDETVVQVLPIVSSFSPSLLPLLSFAYRFRLVGWFKRRRSFWLICATSSDNFLPARNKMPLEN